MKLLDLRLLEGTDVAAIARELLGSLLLVQQAEGWRGGYITELEAYAGVNDRASHAYGGRRTARTEPMFGAAGHLYVYQCYGIHRLLNVVTAPEGIPHAILIRALQPVEGLAAMLASRGSEMPAWRLCQGPGNVCQALGIDLSWNRDAVNGQRFFLYAQKLQGKTESSARVGVKYAGTDALLPLRYYLSHEKSVSKPLFPKYSP